MRLPEPRILPPNFHSHEHGTGTTPPWILFTPAYSVLPLLRWPLGYHIVHPLPALMRGLALCVLPLVFWVFYVAFVNHAPPANLGHRWLAGFAALSLAASCLVFAQRAIGRRRGEEVHSLEAGFSWLGHYSALPLALTEQLLAPALVAGAGWIIAGSVSWELGWWLMLAGASLMLMARWEYLRRWSQQQATIDDMIRAQTYGERLNRHEAQARARRSAGTQGASADFADTGNPADPPDMAGWKAGSDNVTPDFVAWFRNRRRAAKPSPKRRPAPDDEPDFADLG